MYICMYVTKDPSSNLCTLLSGKRRYLARTMTFLCAYYFPQIQVHPPWGSFLKLQESRNQYSN